MERVRQALLRSPGRSARRHSFELGLSNRSVSVYEHKPHTLEELKEAICEEVTQIDRATIEKVCANFQERLQKCIAESGHHMTDVVFHI